MSCCCASLALSNCCARVFDRKRANWRGTSANKDTPAVFRFRRWMQGSALLQGVQGKIPSSSATELCLTLLKKWKAGVGSKEFQNKMRKDLWDTLREWTKSETLWKWKNKLADLYPIVIKYLLSTTPSPTHVPITMPKLCTRNLLGRLDHYFPPTPTWILEPLQEL